MGIAKNHDAQMRLEALVRAQDGKCAYCDVKFSTEEDEDLDEPWIEATFDHVVPKSKGGSNAISNGLAACAPCNTRKGNRHPTRKEIWLRDKIAAIATPIYKALRAERTEKAAKEQETESALRRATKMPAYARPADRGYVEREKRALTGLAEPE